MTDKRLLSITKDSYRQGADASADALDAARYRWLRQQHWNEAPLCVVRHPRQAVKLGHDCPALDRLDAAVDEAMASSGVAPSETGQEKNA
jgi:hypothetical protein